ncbi:uncharacterized protein EAE98_003337 [Botrytis deweyae]|uniref:VWFC domain-containing protein n=1 Tax=Botrytis deweyae TaxID=2478750 RepID=A0ABQ7ITF3_9HELO|nr:uncharacterized protein EAE98_003337 [Botrytis deweyae]KAF7933628.1 hypothetical protein EAE98_003337 [Botrytis deweyae]
MCYYLGNIWASCPDGYRECRCVSPCTYGTIMHPCGVSSRQFVYIQSMAECPCPNCRFRSPGDLNEDSGSSETEAGSERCDCADGRGGGCACRSGVFGGAERRGAGRRGGTERRGVGKGGIGRGRGRAGRLPSNQTRHNLGNSD